MHLGCASTDTVHGCFCGISNKHLTWRQTGSPRIGKADSMIFGLAVELSHTKFHLISRHF